jgi:hypothetical protein
MAVVVTQREAQCDLCSESTVLATGEKYPVDWVRITGSPSSRRMLSCPGHPDVLKAVRALGLSATVVKSKSAKPAKKQPTRRR